MINEAIRKKLLIEEKPRLKPMKIRVTSMVNKSGMPTSLMKPSNRSKANARGLPVSIEFEMKETILSISHPSQPTPVILSERAKIVCVSGNMSMNGKLAHCLKTSVGNTEAGLG
jgi:hypothetical protein